MDDRIYDEFGSVRRPPAGNTSGQKKNSKAGDFKVSIDFDEVDKQSQYTPKSSYTYGQSGKTASSSNNSRSNFHVSIPEQNRRPYSQNARKPVSSSAHMGSTAKKAPVSKSAGTTRPSAEGTASKTAKSAPDSAAKRQTTQKAPRSSAAPRKKTTSAKNKAQRKRNRKKASIIVMVCLISIVLLTTILSSVALATVDDILALNKDNGQTVSVAIPEGAKFKDVYKILCDNGLVRQKTLVKIFCKFRDYDGYYDKDKETQEKIWKDITYQPGVYYLETTDGIETMLETIKGSAVSKDTVRITFPEGWSVAQIFEKIEKYNVCTAEKLYANIDIVGNQFEFYEDIKSNNGRYLKAEGYLFPDTYDFYIGENANSVLKKLFNNFDSKWTKEYNKQAKSLGMTKDEVIILASIIQREAKDKTQMADISSVLHNRLNNSATYPMLQMNSTKEYIDATNEYGVFTDFYYSAYLDSYNTYSVQGLPAGAICNPGADAIKAALYPSNTNYHFFCHDKDGNVYYAVTAAEHEKNTQKVL